MDRVPRGAGSNLPAQLEPASSITCSLAPAPRPSTDVPAIAGRGNPQRPGSRPAYRKQKRRHRRLGDPGLSSCSQSRLAQNNQRNTSTAPASMVLTQQRTRASSACIRLYFVLGLRPAAHSHLAPICSAQRCATLAHRLRLRGSDRRPRRAGRGIVLGAILYSRTSS